MIKVLKSSWNFTSHRPDFYDEKGRWVSDKRESQGCFVDEDGSDWYEIADASGKGAVVIDADAYERIQDFVLALKAEQSAEDGVTEFAIASLCKTWADSEGVDAERFARQ